MPSWRHRQFFWCCFVSLGKFSYWSKFHVNIITSSRVLAIFFHKGLTKNLEIGNIPVWLLSNIWRLGWVRNTKFGTNVSNEMLLNDTKGQGYSFYRFWVIKGKPTTGGEEPLYVWYSGYVYLRKKRVLFSWRILFRIYLIPIWNLFTCKRAACEGYRETTDNIRN